MARVAPLFVFAGENNWEKTEALKRLKEKLSPAHPESVACELFRGDDKNFRPDEVLTALQTIPWATQPRLTRIISVEKTPPTFQSRLLEMAVRLPGGACCLLETDETNLRGPFFEKLSHLAQVSVFKLPKGAAFLKWLDERASSSGKKFLPQAKEALVERVGEDLFQCDQAVEALATFVGEKPTIDEKDVETLMGFSLSQTSFALARAIAFREGLEALKILDRLLTGKERPHEIMGAVGWQLRRMLRAKELLENGTRPQEAARQLRLRWGEEETFFSCLARFEGPELLSGLQALLKMDQRLKRGRGEGREEVERFLLALCR